jgi:hypothetical protein
MALTLNGRNKDPLNKSRTFEYVLIYVLSIKTVEEKDLQVE